MFISTLVIRCSKCGYESITHHNGKILKDDFIHIKGENIFKNKILCPKCHHDKHEFDHKKDICKCEFCIEDKRNMRL